MARLLYRGRDDDTASVKAFDDDAIPAAVEAGWRLTRAHATAPDAPDEPNPDAFVPDPDAPDPDPTVAPSAETEPTPRRLKRQGAK